MKRYILSILAIIMTLSVPSYATQEHAHGTPVRYIHNEDLSGLSVVISGTNQSIAYYGQSQMLTLVSGGAARTNEIMSVSWEHTDPITGIVRKITASYERKPGEKVSHAAKEFKERVNQLLDWYPPNTTLSSRSGWAPGELRFGNTVILNPLSVDVLLGHGNVGDMASTSAGSGEIMELSWQHDPDGSGPMEPITVKAQVEKRAGESTSHAAKRLKSIMDTMLVVFPANVKK